MIYIGCDPGATGSVSVIDDEKLIVVLRFARMSPSQAAKDIINMGMATAPVVGVLERVHGFLGQGASMSFKFGEAYGRALGMFDEMGVEPLLVEPRAWQKALGVPRTDKKVDRKNWIYNTMSEHYARVGVKIHKDAADSIAIAHALRLHMRRPYTDV